VWGDALEILKREPLVKCDDVYVPQPHFVKACKLKNVEIRPHDLEKKNVEK